MATQTANDTEGAAGQSRFTVVMLSTGKPSASLTSAYPGPASASLQHEFRLACHLVVFCQYVISTLLCLCFDTVQTYGKHYESFTGLTWTLIQWYNNSHASFMSNLTWSLVVFKWKSAIKLESIILSSFFCQYCKSTLLLCSVHITSIAVCLSGEGFILCC